ncbi:DnaJ-like protein [Chloropicon roscoffensis]|uniref:DnaJ-like protein n=2 Tax=Chloropicon roscoffensis TaxID=1461544 RepID=A0AAX4NWR7_9CHLO
MGRVERMAPRKVWAKVLAVVMVVSWAAGCACQECASSDDAAAPTPQDTATDAAKPVEEPPTEGVEGGKLELREVLAQGDLLLGRKKYAEAIQAYASVIKDAPSSEIAYLKRSAAYVKAKKVDDATKDLDRALELNPKSKQALLKRAQLRRSKCDVEGARSDLDALLAAKPGHKTALKERSTLETIEVSLAAVNKLFEVAGDADFDAQALEMSKQYFDNIFRDTSFCTDALVAQAKVYRMREDWPEVIRHTNAVLQYRGSHKGCLMMRADAHYQQGLFDACKQTIAQIYRTFPDDKEASALYKRVKKVGKLRAKAEKLAKDNKVRQAVAEYKKIANMEDLGNKEVERETVRTLCTSCHQVEKWQEAVEWCTKGLGMEGEGDVGLLTALAESYLKLERLEEAEAEARKILGFQGNNRAAHTILQQVQKLRKLAERKNYYKILEVPREVDEADVKRAYKKLARKWHPDKNPENREEAEKMFHDIAEAYEVLTDPEKKRLYDAGEDPNDPNARARANPFGAGFGGGGGFQQGGFRFHQGGQRFHQGGQQFHFQYG